jgi:uncharacterized protein (DUF2062 family)
MSAHSVWVRVKRRARRLYVQTLRARGAPHDVALGMAIGLFVAFVPFVQTPVALASVAVVRKVTGIRASVVAAAIGVWLTNPLTSAPLLAVSLIIGTPVARAFLAAIHVTGFDLGGETSWLRDPAVLESAVGFAVGSFVLATVCSVVGYHLTLRGVGAYQARRVARQRARALRAVGLDPAILAPPGRAVQ